MNTVAPEWVLQSEEAARGYLRELCPESWERGCPRCGSAKAYRLSSRRHRCQACRYTFSDSSGRWLGQCRLSYRDWVTVASLFEAECAPEQIAREIGRAYATAFHAVTVLRAAIVAHTGDCGSLVHDNPAVLQRVCSHRGHKSLRINGHAPVFGMRDDAGKVSVPLLADLDPKRVMVLPVKKTRRGNIIYTGQVTIYDSLIFCLPEDGDATHARFSRSQVSIERSSSFWAYALPRLSAHCGVSAGHFPLYIKELEFRYNHRRYALAPLLLTYLCDFVPRSARGS